MGAQVASYNHAESFRVSGAFGVLAKIKKRRVDVAGELANWFPSFQALPIPFKGWVGWLTSLTNIRNTERQLFASGLLAV